MRALARATTYYVTSTRAEGNCLPLMDYLAAGRPAISPKHSAISDYFGTNSGFVVDSHPEPCPWPQDRRWRCRTTWHRIVWPALVNGFRQSYDVACNDLSAYRRLSSQARNTMQDWSHPTVVVTHLRAALQQIDAINQKILNPVWIAKARRQGGRAAA
jgi:hypothetical protein